MPTLPFRVEVNTYGDVSEEVFSGNAMTYDTVEAAVDAAKDLFTRWTAVRTWRVVDADDQVQETGP